MNVIDEILPRGVETGALPSTRRMSDTVDVMKRNFLSMTGSLHFLMILLISACAGMTGGGLRAATYEVGPGMALGEPGEVPWEALQAGDVVRIHARKEPYRAKWVLCVRGEADRPIRVQGVPDQQGALPVIEGNGAVTRAELDFWGEERAVIKVGGANKPADIVPAHVIIENLHIRGARPPHTFTGRGGVRPYPRMAAAIYVENGGYITIRGCVMEDCGNGLMTSHRSREILVEGCHIHGNGIENSISEHNSYTASHGIIFQYNRFGPLRAGCRGNNLKDRSAGLIVRCNWLEGGSRQLDLVDGSDHESIRQDPRYRVTEVHGNVLIEPEGDGNNQIVHYGGDSGNEEWYRGGTLRFHHNTIISRREGLTTLFRLSSAGESVECFRNVGHVGGRRARLQLLGAPGKLSVAHCWLPERCHLSPGVDAVGDRGLVGVRFGGDPGFINPRGQDFRPRADSPLTAFGPGDGAGKDGAPGNEYLPHQQGRERPEAAWVVPGAFAPAGR
ncbi:right-handed parallel beta-helix repeat-containing protein [Luteolibacter sp. SL250]|uniref:right-handed parallel beta-helix repeat-containing protein n=1 Tax=Luteolibacter sp. SL250 TaxID=2995170 RepID=UPI00226F59B5|nr:right-handed parallel beta-helix repeat-containing protein [Luteolibacter sp. SL250]WAC19005.1 right-handed parallel beta-helix repeat-containing protein [Luteolibacter sp. SL250]